MAPRINDSEFKSYSNISATQPSFTLLGGQYAISCHADTWGGGNAVLQRLTPKASTFVNTHTAFTVDGYTTVNLPAGIYQFAVTTATGVYAEVMSIVEA